MLGDIDWFLHLLAACVPQGRWWLCLVTGVVAGTSPTYSEELSLKLTSTGSELLGAQQGLLSSSPATN